MVIRVVTWKPPLEHTLLLLVDTHLLTTVLAHELLQLLDHGVVVGLELGELWPLLLQTKQGKLLLSHHAASRWLHHKQQQQQDTVVVPGDADAPCSALFAAFKSRHFWTARPSLERSVSISVRSCANDIWG